MQRVIEKIMESLRAELLNLTFRKSDRCKGFNDGIHTALKIVQEEAKTGGWIYCSERMPTRDECIQNDGRFIVTDGMRVYHRHFDIYRYNMFVEPMVSNTFNDLLDYSVIAWQPLPAPLKEVH